jgi:peptidoglycan hydrolase-like protein with peptidoglycan-binding domain
LQQEIVPPSIKYKLRLWKKIFGIVPINTEIIAVVIACIQPHSTIKTMFATSSKLQQGSTGDEVTELQHYLAFLKYYTGTIDGVFGTNTKNAVIKFQQQHTGSADGIVGEKTKAAIKQAVWILERPVLKQGDKGQEVKTLQDILKSAVDYGVDNYGITSIDGVFGANTQTAVIKFQKASNLTADGVVGTATWRKLSGLKAYDMLPEQMLINGVFPLAPQGCSS